MKTKFISIATIAIVGSISSFAQQYTVSAGNDVTISRGTPAKLQGSIRSQTGEEIVPVCGQKIDVQALETPPTQCSDCNQTITTATNWQSVAEGDKVFVPVGLASVDVTLTGGTLVLCGSDTRVRINFNKGTLIVYGSVTIENLNMNSLLCKFENYGTVQVNYFNALGTVVNRGRLLVSNYANINGGSITNFGEMQFAKPITVNNATFQNNGTVSVDGKSSINGGSTLVNTCSFSTSSVSNPSQITNRGEMITDGGSLPSLGLSVVWFPLQDLDKPNSLTPIASPLRTTEYTLTVYGASNQMLGSDKVQVFLRLLDPRKYGELDYKPYPKVTMNDLRLLQLYLLGLTKPSDLHEDFAIAADVAPPYSVIDMADFTALKLYILNPAKYPLPVVLANGAF